jgi:hypothetical protein
MQAYNDKIALLHKDTMSHYSNHMTFNKKNMKITVVLMTQFFITLDMTWNQNCLKFNRQWTQLYGEIHLLF